MAPQHGAIFLRVPSRPVPSAVQRRRRGAPASRHTGNPLSRLRGDCTLKQVPFDGSLDTVEGIAHKREETETSGSFLRCEIRPSWSPPLKPLPSDRETRRGTRFTNHPKRLASPPTEPRQAQSGADCASDHNRPAGRLQSDAEWLRYRGQHSQPAP